MKFEEIDSYSRKMVIRVAGMGERGIRSVRYMAARGIEGVDIALIEHEGVSPDGTLMCSLLGGSNATPTSQEIHPTPIGKGLPAKANQSPAAELLEGCDMLVLVTDLSEITESAAAQFAEVSKVAGVLTLAVVSRPFAFEGMIKQEAADEGYRSLLPIVDSLVLVPIEKAIYESTHDWSMQAAYDTVNETHHHAVQGITGLLTRPGLIGIDFADLRTVATDMGKAMVVTATASGEHRARDAAELAAADLRANCDLGQAVGWWVNLIGGPELSISEFDQMGAVINEYADREAIVATGISMDPELRDEVRVTILVTGLDENTRSPLLLQTRLDDDYLAIPAFLRQQVQDQLDRYASTMVADTHYEASPTTGSKTGNA